MCIISEEGRETSSKDNRIKKEVRQGSVNDEVVVLDTYFFAIPFLFLKEKKYAKTEISLLERIFVVVTEGDSRLMGFNSMDYCVFGW